MASLAPGTSESRAAVDEEGRASVAYGPPTRCIDRGTADGVRERVLRLAQEVFVRGLASSVSPGHQPDAAPPQPRPHQLDAVSSLLEAVYWDGTAPAPVNYLLQHSTGSGKSFTIAALAVALAGWPDCGGGCVGTVLVLNDRLQLDRQLGECVEAFWRGNGRPAGGLRRASTTAELSGFLAAPLGSPGRPSLVLTTVQKLATLWRAGGGRARPGAAAAGGGGEGGGLSRIAVIADEAHRHHGHGTTDQIHQILAGALGSGGSGAARGAGGGGGGAPSSRRPQPRQQPRGLTYFGFTATPSPKALQLFGVCREVPADPGDGLDAEDTGTDGEGGGGGYGGGSEAAVDAKTTGPTKQRRPLPQQQQQEQSRQVQGKGSWGAPTNAVPGAAAAAAAAGAPTGKAAPSAATSILEGLLLADENGDGGAAASETALLYSPYHAYTMRSAVQDGFVLDVLRSYTAVTPRLQIAGLRNGGGADRNAGPNPDSNPDPNPDPGQPGGSSGGGGGEADLAEEVLVEAASNSRDVVERKAAYIVQRFTALWRNASAAGFTSFRGMVVARSRQHVVWFVQALRRAVEEEPEFAKLAEAAAAADPRDAAAHQRGPSVFGAFSGTVPLPAAEAAELDAQCRRWRRQDAGCRTGAGGGGDAGADDVHEQQAASGLQSSEGDDSGDEERPSKRRRRDADGGPTGRRRPTGRGRGGAGGGGRPRPASGWDAALSHLDAAAAGETHGSEGSDGRPPRRAAAPRARANGGGGGGARREMTDDEANGGESGSASGSVESSEGDGDDIDGGGGDDDDSGSASGSGSDGEWRSDDAEDGESASDSESESAGGSASEGSGSESGGRAFDSGGEGQQATDGGGEEGEAGGGGGGGSAAAAAAAAATARSGEKRLRRGTTATESDARKDAGGGGGRTGVSCSSLFGSDSVAAAAPSARDSEGAPPLRRRGSVEPSVHAAVRRQASRLTVTSRATSVAAAAAVRPTEGEDMEVEVEAETGDAGGGGGAAAASSRPRRMTRAMSSSAVLGASASEVIGGGDDGGGSGGDAARQPAVQVTEADVNGRGADPGAARLLVVCSKYETGYDDPRLGAMFIDRTLSGARAVQVLGRLNRPAPALGKCAGLLGVVDFVNSVGGLREAFEEFYDITTLNTGKHARRLRQERQMERALSRILEALQPAADRAAAAAADGGGGAAAGTAAAAAAAAAAVGGGGLLSLGVSEMAAVAGWGLAPEARRALEADVGQYVALAGALRVEMPEMPLPFAAALLAKLTADREARERAAAALRSSSVAAAAGDNGDDGDGGGGGGALPDVQVAVCELEETFSGAIYLAPARPPGAIATSGGGGGGGGGGGAGPATSGGGGRAAAAAAAAGAAAAPLRGRPIQGGRSWGRQAAAGGRGGGRGRASGGGGGSAGGGGGGPSSLDRKIRKNRPLSEVIAAANAALDGRYERKLAAGFKEICARLAAATAAATAAAAAAAAAAPAAPEGGGAGGGGGSAAGPEESYGEDLYELLSLLRRLSLWPISVDLLRVTSVGREVAQLRKHACPQVASLARTLVARWKTITAAAAAKSNAATNAGPGAKAGGGSAAAKGGRSASPSGTAAAAAAAAAGGTAAGTAVDEQLRGKVRALLVGSLRTHVEAAARARKRNPDPTDLDPERLALAARELEGAVFAAHGSDGVSYKAQTRMLVGALKHADGVAADLLSGATDPRVMATADSMALAPASVRAQAEELARKKRLEMEAWERLAGQGGGASTYKSAGTVCPSCGGSGATVHNVLSGGTYAQERVQIQKFVCDHCGSTWRND
ncbi:hypothetical protein PLESTB_001101100 [Pleodorina starrii]|uniref:TFIIS N-terminal domain-containing protein n=1 Tax=Pleodorina starrii TaxID=330485 RepID=A0A9W6BQE8_9CHLO|nr:hypothetical protein PLESTB_001101100 [Pleodorina starrii]